MIRFLLAFLLLTLTAASAPHVSFTDDATAFDRIEAEVRALPEAEGVRAFRAAFEHIRPGLYADADDQHVATALRNYPAIREQYLAVIRQFPASLDDSIARFRTVFPDFVPPIPIVLAHEMGMRDGGSAYVGGKKVMLFGADVIAKIHNDNSLEPFMDHELFHLEHARHFADCDQLWCSLWQEGLAVYVADRMTPQADDHQLLLDLPQPIRAPVDEHWADALCAVAANFDSSDKPVQDDMFNGAYHLGFFPPRFGYYVGLRVAAEAARHRPLSKLARLDDAAAGPVVADALDHLIDAAHAPCRAPSRAGVITHVAPRPA